MFSFSQRLVAKRAHCLTLDPAHISAALRTPGHYLKRLLSTVLFSICTAWALGLPSLCAPSLGDLSDFQRHTHTVGTAADNTTQNLGWITWGARCIQGAGQAVFAWAQSHPILTTGLLLLGSCAFAEARYQLQPLSAVEQKAYVHAICPIASHKASGIAYIIRFLRNASAWARLKWRLGMAWPEFDQACSHAGQLASIYVD